MRRGQETSCSSATAAAFFAQAFGQRRRPPPAPVIIIPAERETGQTSLNRINFSHPALASHVAAATLLIVLCKFLSLSTHYVGDNHLMNGK